MIRLRMSSLLSFPQAMMSFCPVSGLVRLPFLRELTLHFADREHDVVSYIADFVLGDRVIRSHLEHEILAHDCKRGRAQAYLHLEVVEALWKFVEREEIDLFIVHVFYFLLVLVCWLVKPTSFVLFVCVLLYNVGKFL